MAHWASKYGVYILSVANYANGVAYSSVQEDYPAEFGPDTLYDTWTGQKWFGRDPVTGYPLLVYEADRYIPEVTTNGVVSTYDGVGPPLEDPLDACSLTAEVTNAGCLSSIDGDDDHVVYGVWNCQVDADPDDLPPALLDYYILSPIPSSRWDAVRSFLIANGANQTQVDNWRTNNPNATPDDIKTKFNNFVT